VGINEIILHERDLIEKRPHNEVVVAPLLGADLKKVEVEECDFLMWIKI
jgi:hypothetical protein